MADERQTSDLPETSPWRSLGPDGPRIGLDALDYTVGWVCALHSELAASMAMLDVVHDSSWLTASVSVRDSNSYVLGSIGAHNVVMACLPTGAYGTTSAAGVAVHMLRTFPGLSTRLMVGIGGGVPGRGQGQGTSHDIRLGDVVVSTKVWQYDMGKTIQGGIFEHTGLLWKPPVSILTAVQVLKARHDAEGNRISETVAAMVDSHPHMARYLNQGQLQDRVFRSEYEHKTGAADCESCDSSMVVPRLFRRTDRPEIHYGCIASGNQVIRHAPTRDEIAHEHQVLCFEMEAAGLMDSFDCLVIRGICDYADSHKNKQWQEYAAATAAAYAKELLSVILPPPREGQRPHAMQEIRIGERRKLAVGSLAFPEMDSRQNNIKEPMATTCQWLLQHHDYVAWRDPRQYSQHRGFWWIKGKPGAGKSTILRFLVAQIGKDSDSDTTLSFFFNARGTVLERSVLGMYRTLLHHLFNKLPALQSVFDDPAYGARKLEWAVPTLQKLLSNVITKLGSHRLTFLVDALDECDQEQVQEMVNYFESLGDEALKSGTRVYICFSSRHYPFLQAQYGRELVLENQQGHLRDLETFVRTSLSRAGTSLYIEEITAQILEKAKGVFIWVSLVVEIVKKEFQKGRIFAVRRRLQELPFRLKDLFKNILSQDGEDLGDLLLCVQWLLFATSPLGPAEFYYALVSGLDPDPASIGLGSSRYLSSNDHVRFVLSSSKGLAQVTGVQPGTVEFIHESVRDFFLREDGLQELWPDLATQLVSKSHDRLKWCCYAYIAVNASAALQEVSKLTRADPPALLRQRLPFLEYATLNILRHANAAGFHIPQRVFLESFDVAVWSQLERIFLGTASQSRQRTVTSSILHYAAQYNWTSLIHAELARRPPVDIRAGQDRYALISAWKNNNQDAFRALLPHIRFFGEAQSRLDQVKLIYTDQFDTPLTIDDLHPLEYMIEEGRADLAAHIIDSRHVLDRSVLSEALMGECRSLARLLLLKEEVDGLFAHGTCTSPLYLAASLGFEEIVDLILAKKQHHGVLDKDLGQVTEEGIGAIVGAIQGGHAHIVQQLLRAGVPTDCDIHGATPLTAACHEGWEEIAAILIESGADVNFEDDNGETPLTAACRSELEKTVLLLLQRGAFVDIRNRATSRLLHEAVIAGSEQIVKSLLDAGADVNGENLEEETPLFQATKLGEGGRRIVDMLLQKGALVDYQNINGETPLISAATFNSEAAVELLILAGADVNLHDTGGNTAILEATRAQGPAILQMLIDAGALLECRDRQGRTPLLLAVEYEEKNIVDMLVRAGASVDCRDDEGRTPLIYAAQYGDEEMVETLIQAGADVSIKDHRGRTYLAFSYNPMHHVF